MTASTALQDEIELSSPTSSPTSSKLLIYFISGNPGLIEYYRRYLTKLQDLLQSSSHHYDVTIWGSSHDGFEFHDLHNRVNPGQPPFSLRQEIDCVKTKLSLKARQITSQSGDESDRSLDVILIGHSVGSYMLLEVLEWWQSQAAEQAIYKLRGGVCLFPTVVDIVKSAKGKQIGWFINLKFAGSVLAAFARIVSFLGLLTWVARLLTPGTEGWEVTAALARSKSGVKQVIHMARDELAQIRHDKWDATSIWGVLDRNQPDVETAVSAQGQSDQTARTKLYFIFGKDDYWVNNESRERLIDQRGCKETHETRKWPRMDILHDRPEIPHTFSLHPEYSDHVAGKTADWIKVLLEEMSHQHAR